MFLDKRDDRDVPHGRCEKSNDPIEDKLPISHFGGKNLSSLIQSTYNRHENDTTTTTQKCQRECWTSASSSPWQRPDNVLPSNGLRRNKMAAVWGVRNAKIACFGEITARKWPWNLWKLPTFLLLYIKPLRICRNWVKREYYCLNISNLVLHI